jgi:hypothetical protein
LQSVLHPALFPIVQVDSPPITLPYPYASLVRSTAFYTKAPSDYNPTFDGPYQLPLPSVPSQVFGRASVLPLQSGYNIASLIGVPSLVLPASVPISPAIYACASSIPTQGIRFFAALFPSLDAPPLYSTAPILSNGTRTIPTQAPRFNAVLFVVPPDDPPLAILGKPIHANLRSVVPIQGRVFSPAFIPQQIDNPPITLPYPYVSLLRVHPMPTQTFKVMTSIIGNLVGVAVTPELLIADCLFNDYLITDSKFNDLLTTDSKFDG